MTEETKDDGVEPSRDTGVSEDETWEEAPSPFSLEPIDQEYLEFLTDPEEGPNLTRETALFLHELGICNAETFVDFANWPMMRVLDVVGPEQLAKLHKHAISIRAFGRHAYEHLMDNHDGFDISTLTMTLFNKSEYNAYGAKYLRTIRGEIRDAVKEWKFREKNKSKTTNNDESQDTSSKSGDTRDGSKDDASIIGSQQDNDSFITATGEDKSKTEEGHERSSLKTPRHGNSKHHKLCDHGLGRDDPRTIRFLRNPRMYADKDYKDDVKKRYSLSSKITWSGQITGFSPFKASFEAHFLQIGAGYCVNKEFLDLHNVLGEAVLEAYPNLVPGLSVDQLRADSTVLHGALKSACKKGAGQKFLVKFRHSQDGFKAWHGVLQRYDNDGLLQVKLAKFNQTIQTMYHRNYRGGVAQFIDDYDTAFTEIDALYDLPQWPDDSRRDRLLTNLFSDETKDIVSQCYCKTWDEACKHIQQWAIMQDASNERRASRKAKLTYMDEDEQVDEATVRQVMNMMKTDNFVRRTRSGHVTPDEYNIPSAAFRLIADIQAKRDFIKKRDQVLADLARGNTTGTKPEEDQANNGSRTNLPKQHNRQANLIEAERTIDANRNALLLEAERLVEVDRKVLLLEAEQEQEATPDVEEETENDEDDPEDHRQLFTELLSLYRSVNVSTAQCAHLVRFMNAPSWLYSTRHDQANPSSSPTAAPTLS